MPIIKTLADQVQVISKSMLYDRKLSAESVGVLCYLLTTKDGGPLNIEELAFRFKCGRKKIYTILRQLRFAKYIVRKKVAGDYEYEIRGDVR